MSYAERKQSLKPKNIPLGPFNIQNNNFKLILWLLTLSCPFLLKKDERRRPSFINIRFFSLGNFWKRHEKGRIKVIVNWKRKGLKKESFLDIQSFVKSLVICNKNVSCQIQKLFLCLITSRNTIEGGKSEQIRTRKGYFSMKGFRPCLDLWRKTIFAWKKRGIAQKQQKVWTITQAYWE